MQIQLKNLNKMYPGFTQAFHIGNRNERIVGGNLEQANIFTTTLMASLSGDYLFRIGAGELNPTDQTRLLVQYSMDRGVSISATADSFRDLLGLVARDSMICREVTALIFGANERPVSQSTIPQVPPTAIFQLLRRRLAADYDDILIYSLTDFFCHLFRPLGWIAADNGLVYRIRRHNLFPTYEDLINVVEAHTLRDVFVTLANSKLDLIKRSLDGKRAMSPAMVAQAIQNQTNLAYEVSRGSYDASSVVQSVLITLGRLWTPGVSEERQPKKRVRDHGHVNALRANLGLFLAYQDMLKNGTLDDSIVYTDEEMVNVVLPLFVSALTEHSAFQTRMLSDTVSYVGKRTTYDNQERPAHVVLYESWGYNPHVTAFNPVKTLQTGTQRYLPEEPHVSNALSAALKPIQSALSMETIVDNRMAAYDLVAASQRLPLTGTEIAIGFPSLVAREAEFGLPPESLMDALGEGGDLVATDDEIRQSEEISGLAFDMVRSAVRAMRRDYYCMAVHLAVATAQQTMISVRQTTKGVGMPFLVWSQRTSLLEPVGNSAVVGGQLSTSEPLEVLVYVPDFKATLKLEAKEVPLAEHDQEIHIWSWYQASTRLELVAPYSTAIRNHEYTVNLREHELLGLGVKRSRVRFLRPVTAASIVSVWVDWMRYDDRFVADQMKKFEKDTLMTDALIGRKIQSGIKLVQFLCQFATAGVGSRAVTLAHSRLQDAMYGEGFPDDYAEIHVGIEALKIQTWAGVCSLLVLQLISEEDARYLIDKVVKSGAIGVSIGAALPLMQ